MKEYFTNLIYQNENDIFATYKQDYPSEFDQYKTSFKSYNYDNLCANFTWTPPLTKADCAQINDKIIEKGLRIAIVSYTEDTRKLLSEYWFSNPKD